MKARRIAQVILVALVIAYAAVLAAPQALAFPFTATVGKYRVYSERPIDAAALTMVLVKADARLATSPINQPPLAHSIFLTDGGWRWRVLATGAEGGFALSRGYSDAIIVNSSDIAGDRVTNGAAIGGTRPLSQVIAHEATHGLLRRRYGVLIDFTAPQWKREGYCDYVAGGGSLSDGDVQRLTAMHLAHPALPYYFGRKRVAAFLATPDATVDTLFGK